MDIKISENLRKLRKQKDLTQEELARFLGVSFQAVSKWERNEGYPDITYLPAIANFFSVTLDELLGMGQIRSKQYLDDVFRLGHDHVSKGEYKQAVKVLRDAIKTFPNNYGLLSELAIALSFDSTETEDGMKSTKEAISLCERVLANSTNEKVRSTTRTTLCFLYKSIGEQEKAKVLAKTLPHFWESREYIVPEFCEEQGYIVKLRESVDTILSAICEKIESTENKDIKTTKNKLLVSLGPQSNTDPAYSLNVIEAFIKNN